MHPEICWVFGTTWPCLKPAEWAAWAQAFAATFAIGIAILVPGVQRYLQRRDEQRKESIERVITAAALVHPMNAVQAGTGVVLSAIERGDTTAQLGNLNPLFLNTPPEFLEFRSKLYLLGDKGKTVNLMIGWLHLPRTFVEVCKNTGTGEVADEQRKRAISELKIINSAAKACEAHFRVVGGVKKV